jgi:lysyl-tRNA synthetase class 2
LGADALVALARERTVSIPSTLPPDDVDGLLNVLFAELVQPRLAADAPEFLYDYPASQAALARVRGETPPVAERFELFSGGVELCNGYHELTDAAELRRRQEVQSRIRERENAEALPQENRLLAAMDAGLPPCAGVALGVDRLLLVLTRSTSLADVLAFPFDRA